VVQRTVGGRWYCVHRGISRRVGKRWAQQPLCSGLDAAGARTKATTRTGPAASRTTQQRQGQRQEGLRLSAPDLPGELPHLLAKTRALQLKQQLLGVLQAAMRRLLSRRQVRLQKLQR
jgi:hypothetical protein